jgi:hypothetical protein
MCTIHISIDVIWNVSGYKYKYYSYYSLELIELIVYDVSILLMFQKVFKNNKTN